MTKEQCKILVSIPSKGRPELLEQCLKSLSFSSVRPRVAVMATELDDYRFLKNHFTGISVLDLPENGAEFIRGEYMFFGLDVQVMEIPDCSVVDCQNFAARHIRELDEYFLPASDDVIFEPRTLEMAVLFSRKNYPMQDGVVGLNQFNVSSGTKSAFMLIGPKFVVKHCPHGSPFYPRYRHFAADTDLAYFARAINKFGWAGEAKIRHLHPCTGERGVDETHTSARRVLQQDLALLDERKKEIDELVRASRKAKAPDERDDAAAKACNEAFLWDSESVYI